MTQKCKKIIIDDVAYEVVPPDGGWGYLVALATTVMYLSTVVPIAGFGIIFKDFFASFGDETRGITLTNSIFNTVSFFMGLVTNILLIKISYRKVALLGSMCHIIGTVGTIFITNLPGSILFIGIFQGMGFGLLQPAALSAFNEYFDKRLQLWISISQTGMVIGYMSMPFFSTWSLSFFGFRGTLLVLMGLSLLTLPVALTLQPVKQHLKMIRIHEDIEMLYANSDDDIIKTKMNKELPENDDNEELKSEKQTICHQIRNSFGLLMDPKYLNLSIGLALCFTADIAFYPIIPLVLAHLNYTNSEIAAMMSVYFGADLLARIGLSLVSVCVVYKSRRLFYAAALLSSIFRIGWLTYDSFWWKTVIMAVLGTLRCFIETLVSLVISEEYPDRFSSAFSLYMVANGSTCLICGAIMNYIKYSTSSDIITCHVLTAAFLISVTSWSVEWCIREKKK
ncbi:monocarboxylate transporter 1-like [Sitophilus oryzae]|uniref:Monocarboxylate transporter 1-like n=1 Tax=Sitophilus oryzae TaxID=7048 RepID=A0A6J2XEN1_SITOR|nr:monocarboxylate transporter 1-like [Sitophilus oryzae]